MLSTITLIVKPNNQLVKALQVTVFTENNQIIQISSFYYNSHYQQNSKPQFNIEIVTTLQINQKPSKIRSSISLSESYMNFENFEDFEFKNFLFTSKIKELNVPAMALSKKDSIWKKEIKSLVENYANKSISITQLITEYVNFIKKNLDINTSIKTEIFSKSFKL